MVGAQNLQVAQLIPHAQLVVCLKLVAVAGAADTLKVFAAVWIPCSQSPDKPCRDDVIHITFRSGLFEVHSTGLHFPISSKGPRSMSAPASSVLGRTAPFA